MGTHAIHSRRRLPRPIADILFWALTADEEGGNRTAVDWLPKKNRDSMTPSGLNPRLTAASERPRKPVMMMW